MTDSRGKGKKKQATADAKSDNKTAYSENGSRVSHQSVNSALTNTARTELHSMITFHHANTRGSRAARLGLAHFCVMSCSLPHLTLTTSTSSLSPVSSTSPIFPKVSPAHKIYDPRPIFTLRCSTAEWRINTNTISHRL